MLRKLGLAGAVLGTVLSLALPVSGLAMERNGRNDGEYGYSWAEGTRGYTTPTNRIRFDQSSRYGVRSDREGRFQTGRSDSRIRYTGQNTDRGGDNGGLRDPAHLLDGGPRRTRDALKTNPGRVEVSFPPQIARRATNLLTS